MGIAAISRITLWVFLVVNLAFGLGFGLAIVMSFLLAGKASARLTAEYGATVDPSSVLVAIRLLFGCGIVAAAVLHRVFTNLLAILRSVRSGDPFTKTNATRLRAIGWALLTFQVLDLGLGGFAARFAYLHVRFMTWSPAVGGWLAVLLVFVLADVFRRGAAMRDDLAATI